MRSSFASRLWLVVEAIDGNKEHYGTYFVEGNTEQYYDARDPRQHEHCQLVDWQSEDEQNQLRRRGFQEAEDDEGKIRCMWERWHEGDSDRKKYCCVLRNDRNCCLQDMVVINVFDANPEMEQTLKPLMRSFHFSEMIELVLNDPTMATHDEKRQNLRVDIGFSPRNSTDGNTVEGLHLPKRRKLSQKDQGTYGDTTYEHSMFKMGRAVMKLSDAVASSHPHKKDDLAKRAFVDRHHAAIMKELKWADQLGLPCDENNDRFSASSFFVCGEVKRALIKTEKHKDTQNCASNPRSPTVTKLVTVSINGRQVQLRGGLNVCAKGGNTAMGKKLETLVRLANDLDKHMIEVESLPCRPRRPRQLSWDEMCAMDNELSFYIDLVLQTMRERRLEIIAAYGGEANDWNTARHNFATESLLSMTRGSWKCWKAAFGKAVQAMCRERKPILEGFGMGERAVESLANMRTILKEANNHTSDTNRVLRSLTLDPARGGLLGVGKVLSTRLLDAAVKLKVVHNTKHAHHCRIDAMSELMRGRLSSKCDMQNRTHAREVIPYLMKSQLAPRIESHDMCARWLMDMVSPEGNKGGSEQVTFLYVMEHERLHLAVRSGRSGDCCALEPIDEQLLALV